MSTDDSVFASLQQVAGVCYNNAMYNRDIIDGYLLRKAREKGVRLPTGGPPAEYKFLGAHVETPTAGSNSNVVYIDVSSMYPSQIMSMNASPETVIGTQEDVDESRYDESDCVWGHIDPRPVKHLDHGEDWHQYTTGEYKMVYDPTKNDVKWSCDDADGPQYTRLYFLDHDVQKGFLTECVEDLIDLKNQYRGTSLYGSTKRVTNSIYGTIGFASEQSSFRLFDWRIAEAITLCGRKMIQYSRDYVLDHLHDNGYTEAYAALGDTDGVGIAIPSVSSRHEAMDLIGDAVERLNGEGYDTFFAEEMGIPTDRHHGEIEIESYAPTVFVPSRDPPHGEIGVKKRYITWETWNDDDGECDELSITGLEAERSDVAPITQEVQQLFAETLRMNDTEAKEWLYPRLRTLVNDALDGRMALTRLCKRKGIGQDLSEYGSATRKASTFYRGAKYANDQLAGVTIQRGDKPAMVYLTSVPVEGYDETFSAETAEDGQPVDVVTLPDPSQLPDGFAVDYEKHVTKTIEDPLRPLVETRFGKGAWNEIITNTEQTGLGGFA